MSSNPSQTVQNNPIQLNPGTDPFKPGKDTSEWKALLIMGVKNVLMFLVLLGWISADDSTQLMDRLTAIIAALGIVGSESFAVWRYISSRTQIKERAVDEAKVSAFKTYVVSHEKKEPQP